MALPDLAVVGGGLVGRLLAWRAARTGMSVELYEAGGRLGEDSAAWAAAGMVAPGSESRDASAEIVAMGKRSLELWPTWLKELPVSVYYRDPGTLTVWHELDPGEGGRLEAAARSHGAEAERISHERLTALEPLVAAGFDEALYLPGEAQVDNREVLAALALGLEEAGVACHWHTRVPDERMPAAELVADCRGMGSREVIAELRGIRGEILRLHAPGVELRHMLRLIGGLQPVYVVPRAEGRLVVGATAYESDDRSPASVGGVMRLLEAAVSLMPDLAEARILEFATQVRPAMADRQPMVRWDMGSLKASQPVLQVNGLYRHGFLLSPALVEKAITMLLLSRENIASWHGVASL